MILCSKICFAVFPVGFFQKQAAGHLLYRFIDASMKNRRCLNLIGPMKSNWISEFVLSSGGKSRPPEWLCSFALLVIRLVAFMQKCNHGVSEVYSYYDFVIIKHHPRSSEQIFRIWFVFFGYLFRQTEVLSNLSSSVVSVALILRYAPRFWSAWRTVQVPFIVTLNVARLSHLYVSYAGSA